MSHDVIGIDVLLAELGYTEPSAQLEARHAIEAAGLSNPRKRNILLTKREAVESALAERAWHSRPNVTGRTSPMRPALSTLARWLPTAPRTRWA